MSQPEAPGTADSGTQPGTQPASPSTQATAATPAAAAQTGDRPPVRTVFIVSDGTGITAETFSHSILAQFEMRFRKVRMPFVDTPEKAHIAVGKINEAFHNEGVPPIVFTTLVNQEANKALRRAKAILVGVSRSGKTPTSLYLAMQYGLKAANYPLIPDDFERGKLPSALYAFKSKVFGLSIDPQRLTEIRNERRPGSKYAAVENCRYEVNEAEAMMRREGIKWLSSTHKSIEEIATTILQEIKVDRDNY
ncbi:Phosphoenolpyruvate synthase regulatory protein [compost metagenome]